MQPSTARRVLALLAAAALLHACAAPGPTATPASSSTLIATPTTKPIPTPAPTLRPTTTPSPGPTTASGISLGLEPFATGIGGVFMADPPDGQDLLYVVLQAGSIVTVEPDGSHDALPFLDIQSEIVHGGEQGLLGLAFHPGYPRDPRFYVMYTAAGGGANTVSEFRVTEGVADLESERVLLSIDDFAGNHNGGMIAFGADGYLYIGTGDGGGGGDPEGNGQDAHALLGKILRIDVNILPYAIPRDNPSEQGIDVAREVWDLGLRNPWRFSFDRETGDLWIGDVGQGLYEEIDAEPAGQGGRNYGWNVMEGRSCYDADACDQTGLTLPVAAHHHQEGVCAIIGGYVYRGEAVPEANGTYVYSDFCTGEIWALDAAAALAGEEVTPVELTQLAGSIAGFGQDEHGELYALNLSGTILHLVFAVDG
ncbi:MAG: PQQ-dependent sugar dehydrogenase [Candidatus Limnocylindrales bacterium]